ncbi:MAG: hypothetical protein GF401_20685 [Chitinivibrionales bacterium]|nr:hypothetical protein [Chitinivibrionales bacterium]
MKNNGDDSGFEKNLREILDSGGESNPKRNTDKTGTSPEQFSAQEKKPTHSTPRIPAWVEIIVRIIAIIIVVILLFQFGINIATR